MSSVTSVITFFIWTLLQMEAFADISCRDLDGSRVDWFIGYKLPSRTSLSGLSLLYADGRSSSWSAPRSIESSGSAVKETLSQMYASIDDFSTFYMLYNDDHPDSGKSDTYRGHAKGALVFDDSSGFWLIHSVPNFPPANTYAYPSSGLRNGQSFLCISFRTDALADIAQQMQFIQPSVYSSQLPTSFASRFPELQRIISKKSLPRNVTTFSSVRALTSARGEQFTSFAKHKKFAKDLYADLMAPSLKSALFTETWMNGPGDLPSCCSCSYQVYNVQSVNVSGSAFPSSKDHSKWAISKSASKGVICVGDINRQKSQSERGGGSICFRNNALWSLFRGSIVESDQCSRGEIVGGARRSQQQRPPPSTSVWRKMKELIWGRN